MTHNRLLKDQIQYQNNISQQKMQQQNPNIRVGKKNNQVQSTCLVWPNDNSYRDSLSIPLSLIIQPLQQQTFIQSSADQKQNNKNHQQINRLQASFSGSDKINQYRCHTCKAFVNSYCIIRSKFQYDCSICGCTNRLTRQINSLANQFISPVFTCKTNNPTNRTGNIKDPRTFVFLIDYSGYGLQTTTVINYVITIIRDYINQIISKHKQQNSKNKQKRKQQNQEADSTANKIKIMIMGFDDRIHEYRIVSDIQEDIQSLLQQNENQKNEQKKSQNNQEEITIERLISTSVDNNLEDYKPNTLNKKNYLLCPTDHKHSQLIQKILRSIEQQVGANLYQGNQSRGLIPALERILYLTNGCAGKVYVITGYRIQVDNPFLDNIFEEPEQFHSNFTVNIKKNFEEQLLLLLEKTQMSISIFLYNDAFINLLPLYAITKLTNGQIKHYAQKSLHQLYYQLYYSVCVQSFQLATQTVVKVRHPCGIKLLATFGQYRVYKGFQDQIELLSCPTTRMYMFQFYMQGRIQQQYINIQFSILYTDKHANRVFKILTYNQKISSKKIQVLDSINYGVVNQCYLLAALHNMDLNSKTKNLQISLQQRCKKHLKFIQTNSGLKQSQLTQLTNYKRCKTYIMFTYYLMRHFILNTKCANMLIYDKSVQMRSRINTSNISGIHSIWPVVYSINGGETGTKIVQMRYQQVKNTKVAILLDQGDFCHVLIISTKLRRQINKQRAKEPNKELINIIGQKQQLKQLYLLLKQLSGQKLSGYVDISLLQNLQSICILDQSGDRSYDSFISNILS